MVVAVARRTQKIWLRFAAMPISRSARILPRLTGRSGMPPAHAQEYTRYTNSTQYSPFQLSRNYPFVALPSSKFCAFTDVFEASHWVSLIGATLTIIGLLLWMRRRQRVLWMAKHRDIHSAGSYIHHQARTTVHAPHHACATMHAPICIHVAAQRTSQFYLADCLAAGSTTSSQASMPSYCK